MVALFAIRSPHALRSLKKPILKREVGSLEAILYQLAKVSFALPLVWVATPLLSVADYNSLSANLATGVPLLVIGLWLFWRAHADLRENWSPTLELREGHHLVTSGVYARVRHPMYLACLIFGLGLLLVLPNMIAGPAFGAAMLLLTATRLHSEEKMLAEHFDREYADYRARTRYLIPGVW